MSTKINVQAVEAVTARLDVLGFKRRQVAGVFTIDVGADVLGWLGLNRATKHLGGDAIELNPVVGVRHQEVERLVAELRGEKLHRFIPPTVSRPIGYLMPVHRYVGWRFESEAVSVTADELAAAVEHFAVPAMRSVTDLAQLRRRIEDGWGFASQLVYRLPAVRWLEGDERGALEALDAEVGELGDRVDPAAEELRSFVRSFREHVSCERLS